MAQSTAPAPREPFAAARDQVARGEGLPSCFTRVEKRGRPPAERFDDHGELGIELPGVELTSKFGNHHGSSGSCLGHNGDCLQVQ